MKEPGTVFINEFNGWRHSCFALLDGSDLPGLLRGGKRVLLKPNLVEALEPPITTPVALVAAIVEYLRDRCPGLEIIIGEGSGAREYETGHSFKTLGYTEMAGKLGVGLIDLNQAPLRVKSLPGCRQWPEMYLPEIVYDSFLFSIPVLKAHSLASVTLTMKNMMGCAPPAHYQRGGHWKKAAFHANVQEAVLDLNRYRSPDFTLLDATVGMQEAHLWGPHCDPPHEILAASTDPVAIDAYGAGLLGRDWREIGHLAEAHGELGVAAPLRIIKI